MKIIQGFESRNEFKWNLLTIIHMFHIQNKSLNLQYEKDKLKN